MLCHSLFLFLFLFLSFFLSFSIALSMQNAFWNISVSFFLHMIDTVPTLFLIVFSHSTYSLIIFRRYYFTDFTDLISLISFRQFFFRGIWSSSRSEEKSIFTCEPYAQWKKNWNESESTRYAYSAIWRRFNCSVEEHSLFPSFYSFSSFSFSLSFILSLFISHYSSFSIFPFFSLLFFRIIFFPASILLLTLEDFFEGRMEWQL